jgi:hypothetical protein
VSDETQIGKLHDLITNVRLDIARLDQKVENIKDLTKKVEEVDDTAKEALSSTKSAHKRLDKHDKVFFWAATTIISALIVGAITLLFKFKGA